MDKIAPLLEKLAEKLGTTSEYIWGVLIKQAPISGVLNIIALVFIMIISTTCFIFCLNKFSKKFDEDI